MIKIENLKPTIWNQLNSNLLEIEEKFFKDDEFLSWAEKHRNQCSSILEFMESRGELKTMDSLVKQTKAFLKISLPEFTELNGDDLLSSQAMIMEKLRFFKIKLRDALIEADFTELQAYIIVEKALGNVEVNINFRVNHIPIEIFIGR